MKLIKEIGKNYLQSTAVTLGLFTALGIWGSGVSDIVEEKTKKVINKFSKKKEEES